MAAPSLIKSAYRQNEEQLANTDISLEGKIIKDSTRQTN